MARIIAFGEIMARMAPPGVLRLAQVLPGALDVTFAGAEANVAASLAMLNVTTELITALPLDSPLTGPCLAGLRGVGIGISGIRLTDHGRFGIYFVETGANQRPGRVFYDREYSAISLATPGDFDWPAILSGADWLHLTGITPGLSSSAAQVTLAAAEAARDAGVRVSFDVNYRSKLWRWKPGVAPQKLAVETLQLFLPFVDLLFAGSEDLQLLGIAPDPQSVSDEQLPEPAARNLSAARAVTARYRGIRLVASTLRVQHSASHNDWGGFLYDADSGNSMLSPLQESSWAPYEIRSIVDRVGAGDAFDAGILFGLTQPGYSLQQTLNFATASSCLAHSVVGDWNFASRTEIEELMHGSGSGRIVR